MRLEFILLLLGIICMSTMSSLLTGYVNIGETDKVLLDTVLGSVGAGNFSYWQLGHAGTLLIELTSLSGDADLYVADTVRPGYEIDKNNFSSVTCGLDGVIIPPTFPRPIGIGVYGHWSSALSEYSIQVFLDNAPVWYDDMDETEKDKLDEKEAFSDPGSSTERPARITDEEPKPRFLRLLNVLDMIFEMFVL